MTSMRRIVPDVDSKVAIEVGIWHYDDQDPIAFIEHGTYPSYARVQMPVDALEAVRDAINALLVEASPRLRPRDDGRPAA